MRPRGRPTEVAVRRRFDRRPDPDPPAQRSAPTRRSRLAPRPLPVARVVVLAQAFAGDGADHAVGQVLGLLLVAEPAQPDPDHPGRVDPGRPAPVAADRAAAAVGLVAAARRPRPRAAPPGSGTRSSFSRCSSTRRRPIASGRSGSASGASARPGDRRRAAAPPGCASSTKRPRALVPEPLDQRRRRRGPAERLQRERPHRVDQRLAEDRPAASRIRRASKPSRRLCATSSGKPSAAVGAPAPDRFELGRGVEARLVGLDDPEQPVALEVAVGGSQSIWAPIRGSSAGSPTAIRQAQASSGGWIVSVWRALREATL